MGKCIFLNLILHKISISHLIIEDWFRQEDRGPVARLLDHSPPGCPVRRLFILLKPNAQYNYFFLLHEEINESLINAIAVFV
jgi:hypothetical protein